jgi:HAE1 family hydrophobic/amphiphilic exporter-1
MNAAKVFLIALCLLAPRLALFAQAPARVGVGPQQRRLTLHEAVQLALQSNLEIEIERANTATAGQLLKAARGAFDPTLRWTPGIESRNTPVGSVLQGAGGKLAEHFHTQNFNLAQRLPWTGTSLRLDFENGRSSTSNPFASLSPSRSARLLIGFTHPLLRNRTLDRERAEVRIRNKQVGVSQADFEVRVIDVINRVEQAYWDLVAARQDVEVKEDGVRWAREQLERNRRMIAAGSLAQVELSASEAELQRRLDTWYSAIGILTEVENALKNLLAPSRAADLWPQEILPAEVTTLDAPPSAGLDQAVTDAIRQRPELRQVGLRQDVNDVQKKLAEDQTRPQLNLTASYWNSGIGGTIREGENPFTAASQLQSQRLNQLSVLAGLPPLPPASFGGVPENLVGGYGTALSNLFAGRFQSVQVGLAFDLNLRNRTAEANLSQALIAERRLKAERERIEQAIAAQVRNAMQAIETARQRIAAAEASARAAKEKLDSETRLFQAGESTNFLVLTRQNEYLDSKRRVVVANLDYNKAVSRLSQATGNTLALHKVALK